MDKWIGKVAVVTGASSGIGKDISIKLVEHGLKVVGCSRYYENVAKIQNEISKDAKGEFTPFKCDVRKEEDVLSLFHFIKTNFQQLSILINNAGALAEGSILEGKTEDWKAILDTNILGLAMCTREAFSLIHENEKSSETAGEVPVHIINISSIVGHIILPSSTIHMYNATKFAVTVITEATRQELREKKSLIRVTQISPGYVDTGFVVRGSVVLDNHFKEVCGEPLQSSDISEAIIFVLGTTPRNTIHDVIIRPTTELF